MRGEKIMKEFKNAVFIILIFVPFIIAVMIFPPVNMMNVQQKIGANILMFSYYYLLIKISLKE